MFEPQKTMAETRHLKEHMFFFHVLIGYAWFFSVDPKENCEISPSMLDALPLLEVLESPTCQLSPDFRCGSNERPEKRGD